MGELMKHILLVDDNVTNLKLAAQVLQPYYELSMAKSGKQALNYLKKSKPDLILLDLIMPEMDGYQTMEEIKLNPETQDIPIILLTADNQRESEIKALQLGALDFITKPFEEEVMLGRIEKILMMDDMRKELIEISDKDSATGLYNFDYVKNQFNNYTLNNRNGAVILLLFNNYNLISSNVAENYLTAFNDFVNNELLNLSNGCLACKMNEGLFLITVLEACDEALISELLNKLIVGFTAELEGKNGETYNVSIKAGASVVSDDHNIDVYYAQADKALYFAANTENIDKHIFKELLG